ncbi:MAG: SH3 domain-containing protein [Paracoccaceae bacterium]
MIRLLLILVAGIGLVMYFADEIGGTVQSSQRAEATPKVEPLRNPAPAATVTMASLGAEPAEPKAAQPRRARPARAPSDPADMVSFLNPVVIGADGKIVPQAAKIPTVEPAKAEAITKPQIPVRYVTASRVNVRGGPSTADPVVGSVDLAEAVQVLSDPTAEWVLIRIEGDGIEGFVASKFLDDTDPQG